MNIAYKVPWIHDVIGAAESLAVRNDSGIKDFAGLAGKLSGLKHVINILRNTDGVAFTFFDAADVVRHPLVQRIVKAYEAHAPNEDK